MARRHRVHPVVLLSGLAAWAAASAEPRLWVVNAGDDSVSVVTLDGSRPTATLRTGKHPQDIVVSSDGSRVYIAEAGGNAIAVHEVNPPRLVRRIELAPYEQPHLLQLSRDGRRLWAACGPQKAIVEIDLEGRTPLKAWGTEQAGSYMFAVTPDERKLYAANFDAGTVTAIDLRTGRRTQVTVGGKPIGIDASPDGREVWVSALGTDQIAVLATVTNKVIARFPSGGTGPDRLRFTPDGSRVVVTQSRSNEVVVLDARARVPRARIPTGPFPKGLRLSADGKTAFVSEMESGQVAQVDLESAQVVGHFQVGESPEGLALVGNPSPRDAGVTRPPPH